MIIIKRITLAIPIVMLLAVPALAATAWVETPLLQVPIGGNASTVLYIQLNATDYINETHWVWILVKNTSTLTLSDKLNVSVVGYPTYKNNIGTYYFQFTPTAPGIYSFTLNISTNNTNLPNVYDLFAIDVDDYVYLPSTTTTSSGIAIILKPNIVTATIFGAAIIPELATFALVGLGLAIVTRKFK